MAGKIRIDPEFSKLLPVPLEDDELKTDILEDGRIFEPLVLWKHQNTLLDGHRRFRVMQSHPHIKAPKPIVLEIESRQEAHDWIINHQLSKRNVTEEQRRQLIGKRYNLQKQPRGRPGKIKSATVADLNVAQKIAEEHGISERTVRAAGRFAEAIDAVTDLCGEAVKSAVLSEEISATTKDLESLAKLPANTAKAVAREIALGEVKSVKAAIAATVVNDDGDDDDDEKDMTVAEQCESDNKEIESFCRSLLKFFDDGVPRTRWSDTEGRIDSARSGVRSACQTLRGAKAVICPQCEGDGCNYCKKAGYLPKYQADQIAGLKT